MTKPKGWKNEPGRHSLAARGIKTGSNTGVSQAVPKLNKDQLDEINELQVEIDELQERYDELEEGEDTDEYDNMIDDSNPEVRIGNLRYSPSEVLKSVDGIAYRTGYNDWSSSEMDDLRDQIEDLKSQIEDVKNR